MNMGILDELYKMLISSHESYRRECSWTISNILSAGQGVVDMLINHPIFDEMINRLAMDSFAVKD